MKERKSSRGRGLYGTVTTILDSQKKLTLSLSLVNLIPETRPFSLMSEGIEGTVPIQLIRLRLDSQVELEPVDEQPNHTVVHLDGSGKIDSLSH